MFVFDVKEATELTFEGDHADNEEDPLVIEDDVDGAALLDNGEGDPIDEGVDEVIN